MATEEITQAEDVLNALGSFLDKDELHGFPIREWTPSQFAHLHVEIQTVVAQLKADGASLTTLQEFITEHWATLINALIPCLPTIILKSCPTKTLEDLDKLTWLQGVEVMTGIIKKNMSHVADFFGHLAQSVEQETSTPSPTPSSQK
jgi:hypothetical protein